MKHFYIIANEHKDPGLKVAGHIKEYLEANGRECSVEEKPGEADCMLVLGGDGTMLQAARDTIDRGTPLLGVNLGTLGYLAEVELSGIDQALEQLLRDEYDIEERMMLSGSVDKEGEKIADTYALNDIVLSRKGSLQIINFDIYVNGQYLNGYCADGIIVATPTGSTGYNMSAGGPIVEPGANLILLTPICPHTLNSRSIVLSSEDCIRIQVGAGKEGQIHEVEVNFDGNQSTVLCTGDSLIINKSEKKTRILKLSKVSFLEVLHKKMSM